MPVATLEHANITVSDPDAVAARLCKWFGWHVRWQGEAMNGLGRTVHVGGENSYIALYTQPDARASNETSYNTIGGFNHVGIVVDDLDAVERVILDDGYETGMHADYEPGRRFYFHDDDNIEFEVVSYK